jgi:hypothetical protein
MNSYQVTVVVSYPVETDVPRLMSEASRDPDWETSALDWTIETSVMIPPLRQTLKVEYEVEGRDETEAERFALAIFERERQQASLPAPETVVANADRMTRPSISGRMSGPSILGIVPTDRALRCRRRAR